MIHKISGIGSLVRGGSRVCGGCRVGLLSRRTPSVAPTLLATRGSKTWTGGIVSPEKVEATIDQLGKSIFGAYVSHGCIGYWLDKRKEKANKILTAKLAGIDDGVKIVIAKVDKGIEMKKIVIAKLDEGIEMKKIVVAKLDEGIEMNKIVIAKLDEEIERKKA